MSELKGDFGLLVLRVALTLKALTEGFAAEAFKNSGYALDEIKDPSLPDSSARPLICGC